MLHFYTYYSVGGYKDMYLGNDGQKEEKRYYLPLLPVEKAQAKENNDATLMAKVEHQLALPTIELLTNDNRFGLPRLANKITTHGGFVVIFTHLEGEKFFIVLRGIQGSDKDENGRPIPFLMSFLSDSTGDLQKMRRLAGYLAQYTQTAKKELAAFLHYDPLENGLCFEQARMLQWLGQVVANSQYETLSLANGEKVQIPSAKEEVALLVTAQSVSAKYVLDEISLPKASRYAMSEKMILPKDNPALAEQYKQEWEEERKRKIRFWTKIGVVLLALILCISLIGKCSHNRKERKRNEREQGFNTSVDDGRTTGGKDLYAVWPIQYS